jgi:hypothetical protein
MATPDAPCVFFCRASGTPIFLWCFAPLQLSRNGGPGGAAFGLAGIHVAGIPTPVWATTHERRNSGGGSNRYMEVAPMATTLTPSHPQFVFVFAAVRRADRQPRICMLRAVAGDEHAARLSLVRDYVLSFAGRLPVAEVRA